MKLNFVKPHKISTCLADSDNCYFHFFLIKLRFHEILFQTDSESFSLLSWKTKKFYSWKKNSKPFSKSKQKSFVYWRNFPEGFGLMVKNSLDFCMKIVNMFKRNIWILILDTMTDHQKLFKFEFQCQELSQSFWKWFLSLNISLGEQLSYWDFFHNFNFWNTLFTDLESVKSQT